MPQRIEVNVTTGVSTVVQLTQAEIDAATLASIKTPQQQRDTIQAQINSLESSAIMPRVTREALLALAVQEAVTAGLTEPQLYASNTGYRKTRDADNAIAALRAQMAAIV